MKRQITEMKKICTLSTLYKGLIFSIYRVFTKISNKNHPKTLSKMEKEYKH